MSFRTSNQQSRQAVDLNQRIAAVLGRGMVEGGEPVEGARPFAVDFYSATAYIDGSEVSMPATSVNIRDRLDLSNDRPDPFKALISIGSDATYHVSPGEPAPVRPRGTVGFDTWEPSPPDATAIPGVPVAEVYVGANAQQITDEFIRDRRITNRLAAHTATAERLAFDSVSVGGNAPQQELADATQTFSDSYIQDVINNDANHGSTAHHEYFPGSHADLDATTVGSSDHHPRYGDAETQTAVEGSVDAADLTASDPTITPGEHLSIPSSGPGGGLTWTRPPMAEASVLDSGTVTHTGGSSTTVTITGMTPTDTAVYDLRAVVSVASDPSWAGEYAYSTAVSWDWKRSSTEYSDDIRATLTFTWDVDPGSGNDLTLQYRIIDWQPEVVTDLYDDADAVDAVSSLVDTPIDPSTVRIGPDTDGSNRIFPPMYATPGDAPGPELGAIITATDANGVYGEFVYDGSAWQGPFVGDLTGLSDLSIDVAKDWGGFRIANIGAPSTAGALIRPQDIDDHAAQDDAHHAQTTSSDIDHAGVANVQTDQHHPQYTDDEAVTGTAGREASVSVEASEIPDGHAARVHAAVGDGEQFVVQRGVFYDEAGNTPAGLTLQIEDVSGPVLYEQTSKLATGPAASPLVTIDGPVDLDVRIHNATGSTVVAGGGINYHIDYIV